MCLIRFHVYIFRYKSLLAEQKELGIGLLVAVGLLILLSRFIANNQPKSKRIQPDKNTPQHSTAAIGYVDPAQALTADDFTGVAAIHRIFISAATAGEMKQTDRLKVIAHRGLEGIAIMQAWDIGVIPTIAKLR